MENYDAAKRDFATRSGFVQKEQFFSPEQQIRVCVPDLNERIREQEETLERASQEQTM